MPYKTYYDDEKEKDVPFTIFIIHGHSKELSKLKNFIEKKLQFRAIVLKDKFTGGVILNKFKRVVWKKSDCAIALMSPDDKLDDENFRARQNVLYEIGYCQGIFDSYYGDYYDFEPVAIIKEKSIAFQEISDLLGVETINYTQGKLDKAFPKIRQYLNSVYEELTEE